jgi:hypothetical protein
MVPVFGRVRILSGGLKPPGYDGLKSGLQNDPMEGPTLRSARNRPV